MSTVYEIKCYPDTKSERTIRVTIGYEDDLFPDRTPSVYTVNGVVQKRDHKWDVGFTIDVLQDDGTWSGHYASHMGNRDLHEAQAAALLRAASFGNGSFPLDNNYLRYAS